jgi:hypothetical protein
MTTLADLTLKQLTAIYSAVSGKPTGPKFFNARATGMRRLEALLAERTLTLADALRAAGIEREAEPAPASVTAPLGAEQEPPAPLLDAATILTGNQVLNDSRDWLIHYLTGRAGLDAETARQAAIRAVAALKPSEPAQPTAPRQPRAGSKQDIVIALLRRPEGATLGQMVEATGWRGPSCRGFVAGALKKRLGLAITSTKGPDGQRVYQLPG